MRPPPLLLQIHRQDNVAVALRSLQQRESASGIVALNAVPAGHKIALRPIRIGELVVKYGYPIGVATAQIQTGEHVHVQNLASALRG